MFRKLQKKIVAAFLLGSLCVHNIAVAGNLAEISSSLGIMVKAESDAPSKDGAVVEEAVLMEDGALAGEILSARGGAENEAVSSTESDSTVDEDPAVQEAVAPPVPTSGKKVCMIGGTAATDAKISLTYNGKKISSKKTPVVCYKGQYMVAYEPLFVDGGPKAAYEFDKTVKHAKLVRQNYTVTFYVKDNYFYASSTKVKLKSKILKGKYTATGKSYIFLPLTDLCSALGMTYRWNVSARVLKITGKKVRFSGEKTTTKYAYSRTDFAKKEYNATHMAAYQTYLSLVTKNKDTTADFQYLRIDCYRVVDKEKFEQYYQYLIEDYCRQAGIKVKKSSLYGKASAFLKVAKKYNLDAIYLVNQIFLESAYGTSLLASGNRITVVADKGFKRLSNGKFKTHKIKKSVKVYNLCGIKAYDTDPYVGGTSYAYYHNWTTVKKAVDGAARYLKNNYIGASYRQNTVFKMRYTFRGSIWHQYATDPYYAEKIGLRMYLMSSCYAKNAAFLYDFPKYR